MGLEEDTGTSASQFSNLALVFYITYFVFEIPQGIGMQRFPTGKWIGANVILWVSWILPNPSNDLELTCSFALQGICVATNSACHSFTSLVAVRVLLGVFESAVAPSLILITTMWYKKHEQPTRMGWWYLGTGCGTIMGAIASFGFQHYDGKSFTSWQIMFLVFGLITIAVGICVVVSEIYFSGFFYQFSCTNFDKRDEKRSNKREGVEDFWNDTNSFPNHQIFLPDNPMSAKFFTREEKLFAIERLRENKTGIENKTFKLSQAIECLRDVHTWYFVVIMISANVSNGAISSFQATIIKRSVS